MFKIGDIEIKNQIVLKICEEMGVGYAITELISSEAIVRNNKKTFDMLNGIDDLNIPVAVQLFGSDPEVMASAAKIICDKFNIKIIDINMGCPVPKVALRAGAGSALLKNPNKIYDIVSKVVSNVSVPVTVKIRSGWDHNSINAVCVAKICERAGCSAISVHARTRSDGYSGKADWNIIKEVKKSVSIPVIGNGDVKSPEDVKKMFDETECDAVMIGRSLLGNPWLIKNSLLYLEGKKYTLPSIEDRVNMCRKHLSYLIKYKSLKQAALEIRSHIGWYLKGVKNAANIKNKVYQTDDIHDILHILDSFMEEIYEEK